MSFKEGEPGKFSLSEQEAAEFKAHFGSAEFGTGPYEAFLDFQISSLLLDRQRDLIWSAANEGKGSENAQAVISRGTDVFEHSIMIAMHDLEVERKKIAIKGYRRTYESIDDWKQSLFETYLMDHGYPNSDEWDEDSEDYNQCATQAVAWASQIASETAQILEKKA